MSKLTEMLARWDSGEGKPYKGQLIDWPAYEADKSSIGCMCAQGQVLHLLGNWSPSRLKNADQQKADRATAKLLNISIAHSILLRSVNDSVDGAPSIVLTNPEKVLGDQAHIVLAFWLHLDRMKAKDWDAAWGAAGYAAWSAARDAVKDAAWSAARDAAWGAARDAVKDAARALRDMLRGALRDMFAVKSRARGSCAKRAKPSSSCRCLVSPIRKASRRFRLITERPHNGTQGRQVRIFIRSILSGQAAEP